MLSEQEEQAEKLRVTLQDADVRRQQQERAGTFFAHAQAQALDTAGGRFGAAMGAPHVIGSQSTPRYPAAGGHQHDPVGPEPPLNFSVNDMPPLELSAEAPPVSAVEHLGAPAADRAPPSELVSPLADDVEPGAGAPPLSAIGGEPLEETFPASSATAAVGSSPTDPEPGNDNG
jgi:hypothetical protein